MKGRDGPNRGTPFPEDPEKPEKESREKSIPKDPLDRFR